MGSERLKYVKCTSPRSFLQRFDITQNSL